MRRRGIWLAFCQNAFLENSKFHQLIKCWRKWVHSRRLYVEGLRLYNTYMLRSSSSIGLFGLANRLDKGLEYRSLTVHWLPAHAWFGFFTLFLYIRQKRRANWTLSPKKRLFYPSFLVKTHIYTPQCLWGKMEGKTMRSSSEEEEDWEEDDEDDEDWWK